MPPRARTPKPEDEKPEPATAAAETKPKADICRRCWPNGWPTENAHSASCVHGQWSRDLPSET